MEEYSEGNGYKKYWQSWVIGSMWGGLFCGTCLLRILVLRLGRPSWSRKSNRYIWKYKKASEEGEGEIIGHLFFFIWGTVMLHHVPSSIDHFISMYLLSIFFYEGHCSGILIASTTVMIPAPVHPIGCCGRQMDNLNRQFQTLVLQSH